METVQKTKRKSGRPIKTEKRVRTTGIRFSKNELFIIKGKAEKAGLLLTQYVRKMAINGEIKRRFVSQLIGMSNNLNQLAKRCHEEGALTAVRHFEKYRNQIDELLNQLRHD